jgi:hypothetical protein
VVGEPEGKRELLLVTDVVGKSRRGKIDVENKRARTHGSATE